MSADDDSNLNLNLTYWFNVLRADSFLWTVPLVILHAHVCFDHTTCPLCRQVNFYCAKKSPLFSYHIIFLLLDNAHDIMVHTINEGNLSLENVSK